MAYMREHGVLKDIYKESAGVDGQRAHRTAKGKTKTTHRVAKAPGFSPVGIMRYVLPLTAFLRLKDIGGNILPPYKEEMVPITMTDDQAAAYAHLAGRLQEELAQAMRCGDKTLMGVVLNVLLAWPDCAFRSELVYHPRTRALLASAPRIFDEHELSPKEERLVSLCKEAKARGRRVLVYTTYTGVRDTTSRLKGILELQGFKVAVLRAAVDAADREDWILEKVDQGIEVIITNPELVKTGLDLMEFPTIVFLQSGYNVYTLQQAARRSWRIGQRCDVEVYFLGFLGTAQISCLQLMATKIAVSQSTSGEMPETGLDVLNEGGDSIEVELARQLLAA
jgi:SNF2 family DNA or RNA helicase